MKYGGIVTGILRNNAQREDTVVREHITHERLEHDAVYVNDGATRRIHVDRLENVPTPLH